MEGVSEPPRFSRAEIGGGFNRLERLLLDERVPVVNVHGAPGSGKSSFVRFFADRRRSAFPGGVVWLVAHGDLDHARFVGVPRDARTLVVLDEVDLASVSSLRAELAWLREERPLGQVVTISLLNFSVGRDTPELEMSPLPLSQVVALLADGAAVNDRGRVERLAKLLEGNVSAVAETSQRLASGMPIERIIEWLERRRLVVARDAQGAELPLGSPGRERIDAVVDEISDELIRELAAHPDRLYELSPRRFEELVAELYRRRGFEATLTPASGDEGVDVYVVRNDELGRTLCVVQAKRYAANRKVGAGVVRELLGTVYAKNASAGIVVTTSFFEPSAVRFEQEFEYRIALRDYLGLQQMLRW
jgi:restriction endonuclease